MGAVVGCGPHDGAVGELFVAPTLLTTPERLGQVVSTAWAFQVGRRGRPAGPRDAVVDVAVGGGHAAAREAARQVAAADEVGQFRRRSVAGFGWGLAGVGDRGDRRPDRSPARDRPGQEPPPIMAAGRRLARRPGVGVRASVRVSSRSGWLNMAGGSPSRAVRSATWAGVAGMSIDSGGASSSLGPVDSSVAVSSGAGTSGSGAGGVGRSSRVSWLAIT